MFTVYTLLQIITVAEVTIESLFPTDGHSNHRLKGKGAYGTPSHSYGTYVTCHTGSHSVTCHPTQVNAPRLTPASKLVLDLPTPEGWKAELT